ncbi:MAG: antiterminator LoaP [Treponema phagedenis]|uniref:antiterminator LoaP n=1 Tax=Treponema phagedenis TaxID=162 RepID=UPI0011E7985F|nr:antiterminator LoaP [Treponema phagedenis]QEJ93913.1 antiterminator LoaP [Treponema phagedenis]QEK02986.1 antiterminator LoaP [Treponema phagedenis]
MDYYALQVQTGKEAFFISSVNAGDKETSERWQVYFPQRTLNIRKKGVFLKKNMPVFPGYVFLAATILDAKLYKKLKSTKGFYRFLPNNQNPSPLFGRDLMLLQHFISFGNLAGISQVCFDENDRIKILAGPLKGLEGDIVKVDKRKGRAKIKLDMYTDSFLIDFGFEILENIGKAKTNENTQ